MFANHILRKKPCDIQKHKHFAVIRDEASDISARREQLSFSIRAFDVDLHTEEVWCGFYEVRDLSGEKGAL